MDVDYGQRQARQSEDPELWKTQYGASSGHKINIMGKEIQYGTSGQTGRITNHYLCQGSKNVVVVAHQVKKKPHEH